MYVFQIFQQRREKDEFKIAELKSEMKRLDEELTSEIKRRTEMNKSTQAVSVCPPLDIMWLPFSSRFIFFIVTSFSGLRKSFWKPISNSVIF